MFGCSATTNILNYIGKKMEIEMDQDIYSKMKEILYHNSLYAFYKGNKRDIDTLKAGEIFLSYADNFNDRFEGLIEIKYEEFAEECLRLRVGDNFYNEIIDKFKFCKDLDVIGSLSLYQPLPVMPNSLLQTSEIPMPDGVSDELKAFILKFDVAQFKHEIQDKYDAYQSAIAAVRNSFGIKCFTLSSPIYNSVMWSHYGDDYKGICCEFPFQEIVYDINSSRCVKDDKYICEHIAPINYVENFNPTIKIDCKKLLRIPIKEISSSEYIIDCVKESLLIKQSQWSHEKEVRLIIRNDDKNIDIIEKTDNGFKIKFPYLNKVYTCNRVSILDRAYKVTRAHRAAKSIARVKKIDCMNLVPSSSKMEFIQELLTLDRRKRLDELRQPLFTYSDMNIPF